MARARSAFVITVSSLAAACTAQPQRVPPPPTPHPVRFAKPEPLTQGAQVNPRDDEGRTVYRYGTGCYIELPFPEPPTAVVPPPTEEIPCPPAMAQDPAWGECGGGTIIVTQVELPPVCQCRVFSNPPPPARDVACPADVPGRIEPRKP